MAGRYFFRPISGQAGSVTSGLGSGIQQGVANYERQRQTRRGEEIQDEDREIGLAERGWQRGQVPQVAARSEVGSTPMLMPELPEGLAGAQMGAIKQPFDGRTYLRPDQDYEQAGGYHRLTEEAMRNRDRSRLGGPAIALMSAWGVEGSSEPFVDLLEAGIDPEQGLPWQQRPGYQALQEQRGHDAGVREQAATDARTLTGIREEGATTRAGMAREGQDARQNQAIRADAFRTMLDQYIDEDDEGNPVYQFPGPLSEMWEQWMSGQGMPTTGEPGTGQSVPASAMGQLGEDELGQVRSLIQSRWGNASEQEIERYLAQAGYSEQEIALILGGK